MNLERGRGRVAGLEVRQLRAFVALVDTGSMSAAARALGLAQSTVSEAMAGLERALGAPIVMRRSGSRTIPLTPAGRALLPHARTVLGSLDDAQSAVAAATREARGSVGVIANESVSTYLLPRALGVLRERWPNTRFAVTVGTCPIVREGLASGRFDVGLQLRSKGLSARGTAPGAESALPASVSLADISLALFCRPEHPVAPQTAGTGVRRGELAAYPVFVTDASGDFHSLLSDFFGKDGVPGPRLQAVGTIESVKRSVATSSRALGVLPEYALAEELRAGLVRSVPVRPALPRVRLEALLSGTPSSSPAAAELIEVLRESLRDSTGTGLRSPGQGRRKQA